MANSKRHTRKKRGPEEEHSGLKRPTRFQHTEEYRASLSALDATTRARLAARGQAFKRDWLKPDLTEKDLSRRWDYKPLATAPKGLHVRQVGALKDYRVALLVVTTKNPCVWLLRAYLRQGKNQIDIERAVETAKRIIEEEK